MYLSPVLPGLAKRSEEFLNCSIAAHNGWQALEQPLLDHKINKYQHLIKRIDQAGIEKMLVKQKASRSRQAAKRTPMSEDDDSQSHFY